MGNLQKQSVILLFSALSLHAISQNNIVANDSLLKFYLSFQKNNIKEITHSSLANKYIHTYKYLDNDVDSILLKSSDLIDSKNQESLVNSMDTIVLDPSIMSAGQKVDLAYESFYDVEANMNMYFKKMLAAINKQNSKEDIDANYLPFLRDKLLTSQLLWLQYRKATSHAWTSINVGGTIYDYNYYYYLTELTQKRLDELIEIANNNYLKLDEK